MSDISQTSRVHVTITHPQTGELLYMSKLDTKRTDRGILIWPSWHFDQTKSLPQDFQTATIIKRRMKDEFNTEVRFCLTTDSTRVLDE